MPRETVRGAGYNFVPIPEGYEPVHGESAYAPECRMAVVEVGWSKYPTGHVEIGSVDPTVIALLTAQMEKAVASGDPLETFTKFFSHSPGVWTGLDRDGCNKLIRRIQHARDQAFGKDA